MGIIECGTKKEHGRKTMKLAHDVAAFASVVVFSAVAWGWMSLVG
jgi:hypothetical protein